MQHFPFLKSQKSIKITNKRLYRAYLITAYSGILKLTLRLPSCVVKRLRAPGYGAEVANSKLANEIFSVNPTVSR